MCKRVVCLLFGLVACSGSAQSNSGAAGAASSHAGATSSNGGANHSNGGAPSSSAGATNASGGAGPSGGSGSVAGGSSSGGSSGNAGFSSSLISLPAKKTGSISIEQYTADKSTFGYDIELVFDTERGQWDGCTRYQLGACWYYDCPDGSNPVGTATNAGFTDDAGTVAVTGMAATLNVPLNDVGTYQLSGAAQLWPLAGGSSVTVAVGGSTSVPAFSMQVPTPPSVWLTSMNGQASPVAIMRSAGAQLQWTSVGTGTAFFGIFAYSGTRPGAFCQFDASAGSGELPAAVLEALDAGGYFYELRGDARSQMNEGTWDIESSAYSFGVALNTPLMKLQLE